MSKHTPGPWFFNAEYSPLCARDENDRIIADCSGTGRSKTEAQANIRLIAAAPELLTACKEASLVLRNAIISACDDPDTAAFAVANHVTLIALRDAIAKAEGEES